MKCQVQGSETTRVLFPPSACESAPPEPENSAQINVRVAPSSNVLQINWTVLNVRDVPDVTMMRILHFSLLIIVAYGKCLKI